MNILDQRVFPFGDDDGRELLAGLLSLYWRADGAVVVVQGAGLDPADYAWAASMADTCPRILEPPPRGPPAGAVTYVESDPEQRRLPRLRAAPEDSSAVHDGCAASGSSGDGRGVRPATLRAHLIVLTR
ncbi:ATP-binding protein [Streptomyces tanashiensis]